MRVRSTCSYRLADTYSRDVLGLFHGAEQLKRYPNFSINYRTLHPARKMQNACCLFEMT